MSAACKFITRTLSAIICMSAASLALAESSRPPNIVLILADDLGYRELGSYGQQQIRTPHLDRLAAQGMRFTQHYSGNAVCAPSRCVLMTGKHPGHAAIRSNSEVQPEGQLPLPADETTLAELLRAAGYATGAFGKWGLGAPGAEGEPLQQGFDRFFGYNCQRHAHSYYPSYLWDDRSRIALDNDPPVPGHGGLNAEDDPQDPRSYRRFQGTDYAPDRIHGALLQFIREHQEEPFFAYYASVIPHLALHVPEQDLLPYLAMGWHDPPFTREGGGYTPHHTPRAAYAAMVSRLDRYVGALLNLLDELELTDNTLVLFTSDNGTTHLGEEVDYEFFQSVGELRGLKGSLYEGGVRVPAIVRWPGVVAAGSTTDYVSGFEDWLPTLLAVAGKPVRADGEAGVSIDGADLLPLLEGHSLAQRPFLYREFPGYGGQQSVRVGRYKAIRTGLRQKKAPLELYDLEQDPGEQTNLAAAPRLNAEYRALVERLAAIMDAQHEPSQRFPLGVIDRPKR